MSKTTKRKLGLLGSLVVAIFIFMGIMFSQVDKGEALEIAVVSFETEFAKEVEEQIPSSTRQVVYAARKNYEELLNEVQTENLLMKISVDETGKALNLVFDAYADYVIAVTNNIKNSGKWSQNLMKSLISNNKLILSNKFCSSSMKAELHKNIEIGNKYFVALSLISSSYNYVSIADSKEKISQSVGFRNYSPFRTCNDLMSNLSGVMGNLYAAHLQYVKQVIERSVATDNLTAVKLATEEKDVLLSNCNNVYNKTQTEVTSALKSYIDKLEHFRVNLTRKNIGSALDDIEEGIF